MSDYISKEDVLKVLKQVFDKHNATDNEIAADCLQAVKNIPAADSLIKRPCNVGGYLMVRRQTFCITLCRKIAQFCSR